MVEISIENSQLQWIDIESIEPNPQNPRGPNVRDEDKHKESLRESIARFGILVPLVIHKIGPGRYRIIDGERRFWAAKSLLMDQVPAIVVEQSLESDQVWQYMFQIHTNWSQWDAAQQCKALQPMYEELVRIYNDNELEIIRQMSDRTGDDLRTIRNRVQFLRWPNDIKDEVYEKKRNSYWYIVEIEDKILEPALKNYPDYFDVVNPSEVRSFLYRKYEHGLVRAATEVRNAAVIARTSVPEEDKPKAKAILKRLVEEIDYSFEEAKDDFIEQFPETTLEPAPSPKTILSMMNRLTAKLENFLPSQLDSSGRGNVSIDAMHEAASTLESTLRKLEDELRNL